MQMLVERSWPWKLLRFVVWKGDLWKEGGMRKREMCCYEEE
jgi:hypothetical protein